MPSYKGHGHELLPKPERPGWIRWIASKRFGLIVAVSVVLLVVAVRYLASGHRSATVQAIATEVGSVAEFWGEVSPNHAGTGIVFKQSTEAGLGVFYSAMPGGKRRLLYELPEKFADKNRTFQNLDVWGWSPGDSHFAFSYQDLVSSNRHIQICSGNTGEPERMVRVNSGVQKLVWLDSESLAYVTDRRDLYRCVMGGEPVPFSRLGSQKVARPMQGLMALTADTVAWHDGADVWSWKFGQVNAEKLWEGGTNALVDFSVDPFGSQLRLRFKDRTGETLARYHLATRVYEPWARVGADKQETNQIAWLGAQGFARVSDGSGGDTLLFQSGPRARPAELVFAGGLNSYVADGTNLYAVGSRAGEPVGIWRFQGDLAKVSCVVSNPQPPYQLARAVAPKRMTLTLKNGRRIFYRLWSPPQTVPGRKYPLLIGKASTRWNGYPVSLANAGVYVVSIERGDAGAGWAGDTLPVLDQLRGELQLDEGNIYLFGASGQLRQAVMLVEKDPKLWRGILMFSPGGGGPSLDKIAGYRLFIDCGADDRYTEYVLKYRDEAVKRGMNVTTVVHEDAEHIYRSVHTLRERDLAVMKFMFGR